MFSFKHFKKREKFKVYFFTRKLGDETRSEHCRTDTRHKCLSFPIDNAPTKVLIQELV